MALSSLEDMNDDTSMEMTKKVEAQDANVPTIPPAVFGASLGMAGFGNAFLFWAIFVPKLKSVTDTFLVVSQGVSLFWLALGIFQAMICPCQHLRRFLSPGHIAMAPGFMAAALLIHAFHSALGDQLGAVLFWVVVCYAFVALVVFAFVVARCNLKPEPSWFPCIVGIGALADPGSADGCVEPVALPLCPMEFALGLMWFAAACTLLLAPVITYRVFFRTPRVADNPTIAILVAPFSLTQLAFFACFSNGLKPPWLLEHVFYAGAVAFFIATIAALYIRRSKALTQIVPEHAAFTFPLVATAATACKYWHIHFMTQSWPVVGLTFAKGWAIFLLLLASIVVPLYNVWLFCHITNSLWRRGFRCSHVQAQQHLCPSTDC